MSAARKLNVTPKADPYDRIRTINGKHPLQDAVLGSHVAYRVRKRKNGKVAYFNFELAKEMGLIAKDHEHKLTHGLQQALLDAFAIQIINEYDIIHETKIPENEIKDQIYMATRYLQLQHPNKTGLTSGDGRSIWNGYWQHKGVTWDLSSCGTGATCLSPATAINKKFYKTGDPLVSYGCGYSDISEGIGNAIFSEIFHRNGIKSERTLLVIEFPRGLAINVRAARNLLRPSHLFAHLKQEKYDRLKAITNFYIDREISNGALPNIKGEKQRYQELLKYIARCFAHTCAKFEVEYIFCWLDWDGDNILCDGGIIDYGSIRQFGMFHHEYRFDDVERWSTTITEQKDKARYIVQTFAQLIDYLNTGKRKPIQKFKRHSILKEFDRLFVDEKLRLLVNKMGFSETQTTYILTQHRKLAEKFQQHYSYFERVTSTQGPQRLEDGVTTNAVFCMRDALRELPEEFKKDPRPISTQAFINIVRSGYANRKDLKITAAKNMHAKKLQEAYLALVKAVAKHENTDVAAVLGAMSVRSSVVNRYDRITGDAMIHIAAKLIRQRKEFPQHEMQAIIERFIEGQVLVPGKARFAHKTAHRPMSKLERVLVSFQKLVRIYREGL